MTPPRLHRLGPALGLAILFALPTRLSACATCFGRSDSALAQGMNMGILSLLIVIFTVLCACSWFFIQLARRSAQIAAQTDARPSPPPSNSPLR